MLPLEMIRLTALMTSTSGSPDVKIGLIDGPVFTEHAAENDRQRDTVLRRLKTMSGGPKEGNVRVLGVDDWAWRKQQRFGTLLMDLERRRVIDLLPVLSATGFADWLRLHPGVEMITRNRVG